MTTELRPIGTIHSPYGQKQSCPIQGVYAPEVKGRIDILPKYVEGLKDIESFSHIILLYRFEKAGNVVLVRPTFLDDEAHGVFASRHLCRPNCLGLSVVKLLSRKGSVLEVAGVDVLDGTPLLDIKPYIPRFDCFPGANEGWVAGKRWRPKPHNRE